MRRRWDRRRGCVMGMDRRRGRLPFIRGTGTLLQLDRRRHTARMSTLRRRDLLRRLVAGMLLQLDRRRRIVRNIAKMTTLHRRDRLQLLVVGMLLHQVRRHRMPMADTHHHQDRLRLLQAGMLRHQVRRRRMPSHSMTGKPLSRTRLSSRPLQPSSAVSTARPRATPLKRRPSPARGGANSTPCVHP